VLRKPIDDAGHVLLKSAGCIDADESTLHGAPILKIMRGMSGDQRVATTGRLSPLTVNIQAEGPREHAENMIIFVLVYAGAGRAWLEPPFGDGVTSVCDLA
jgi:hypothetical protein